MGDHLEPSAEAFVSPRNVQIQRARRVQVWLKHSISSLSASSTADFDTQHHQQSRHGQRRTAREAPPWAKKKRHDFYNYNNQHADPNNDGHADTASPFPMTTSTTSVTAAAISATSTTATIDQAMFSLYIDPPGTVASTCAPTTTLSSTNGCILRRMNSNASIQQLQCMNDTPALVSTSSYVPQTDFDWLLDGRPNGEPDEHSLLSQEYLNLLNQPWDMAGYLDQFWNDRQEQLARDAAEEAKEFQFEADFEALSHQEEKEEKKTCVAGVDGGSDNSSGDDFGDFQSTSVDPTTTNHGNDNQLDSFLPDNHTEDPVELKAEDEDAPARDESDDDSDFGEFVEATSANDTKVNITRSSPLETSSPQAASIPTDMFVTPLPDSNILRGSEANVTTDNDTCTSSPTTPEVQREIDFNLFSTEESTHEGEAIQSKLDDATVKSQCDAIACDDATASPLHEQQMVECPSKLCEGVRDHALNAESASEPELATTDADKLDSEEPIPPEVSSGSDVIQLDHRVVISNRDEITPANSASLGDCGDFQKETAAATNFDYVDDNKHPQSEKVNFDFHNEAEYEFGDFQEADDCADPILPGLQQVSDYTESVEEIVVLPGISPETNIPRPAVSAAASSDSSRAGVRTDPLQESLLRPTFAVLPPLKIDTAVRVQQEAEATIARHVTVTKVPPGQPNQVVHVPSNQRQSQDESMQDDSSVFSLSRVEEDVFSDKWEDGVPISMRLPVADLSSLEGRFARRRLQKYSQAQQEKDAELQLQCSTSSIFSNDGDGTQALAELDLPKFYFTTPDLDDTTNVLQSIPWRYISHVWNDDDPTFPGVSPTTNQWTRDDNHVMFDEHITSQLCKLDAANEQVAKSVLQRIQPHGAVLAQADQLVHELDTNLSLADMYIRRSQASLRQAAVGSPDVEKYVGGGWFGANALLQAWDQKDRYKKLQALLDQAARVFEMERELNDLMANYMYDTSSSADDYKRIIEKAKTLRSSVCCDPDLMRVQGLNELRERAGTTMQTFWSRLHVLSESVAVRCCRRHPVTWDDYSTLVQAILAVREHESRQHLNGESLVDFRGLSKSWTNRIVEALGYEADRALAIALLDPLMIDAEGKEDKNVDSDFDKELTDLGYEVQQDWGDCAKLKTVEHNLVIIRFNFEVKQDKNCLPPVYHRLCLRLADVLYAHHTFVQWHEKLLGSLQLHRDKCESKENEEAKEEKSETVQERQGSKGLVESANGATNTSIDSFDDVRRTLREMLSTLREARESIWNRCQRVLVRCLDEYLHFVATADLFLKEDPTSDLYDKKWLEDLDSLHNVLLLTENFMELKCQFFAEEEIELEASSSVRNLLFDGRKPEERSELCEKLCDVFRKNLRHVHVGAMNFLGFNLRNENWALVSLKQLSQQERAKTGSVEESKPSIQMLLFDALVEESDRSNGKRDSAATLSSTAVSSQGKPRTLFCRSKPRRNPFLKHAPSEGSQGTQNSVPKDSLLGDDGQLGESCVDPSNEVYKMIREVLAGGEDVTSFSTIGSASVMRGLFPWISRLLLLMEKLPIVVEDISAVFANLFDLYFTTVFRLCAGSAASERIIVGSEARSCPSFLTMLPSASPAPKKNAPASSPLFGFRGLGSGGSRTSLRPKIELPRTLEADVCSPCPRELPRLSGMQEFISRAQKSLRGIVMLDKVDLWLEDFPAASKQADDDDRNIKAIRNMEQRVGSAWSCLVLAALLDATILVARSKLAKSTIGRFVLDDLGSFQHYTQAVFRILPELVRLSSRISCARAIQAKRIVQEILEVGGDWEERRLNEHPNDYIDELCGRCALTWAALGVSQRKLPAGVLKMVWQDLIDSSYLCLLEGFSKVRCCSTEGRALMSMDLAAFAAGSNPSSIMEKLDYQVGGGPPPPINPVHGMRYVDTYIKVFYYPKEDVMKWINDNYTNYHLNHCLTLAANAFFGAASAPDDTSNNGACGESSVMQAIQTVQRLYQPKVAEPNEANDEGIV